jgi:hypothetical protein
MTVLQTNLKAGSAVTQFTGYDFNSAIEVEDDVIFATSEGLFIQSGDDDEGEDIEAYFELLTTDFGIPNAKKIRFVYVSYYAYADLVLRLKTELGHDRSFTLPMNVEGVQGYRVPIDSDIYGRLWTFRIENEDSADFSINEIKVLPLVMTHGRAYN